MKRKAERTEIDAEEPPQKAPNVETSCSDSIFEVMDIVSVILQFASKLDILQLALVNSQVYNTFVQLQEDSISSIRLHYLNKKHLTKNSRVIDSRLITLFENTEQDKKFLDHVTENLETTEEEVQSNPASKFAQTKQQFKEQFEKLVDFGKKDNIGSHMLQKMFEHNRTHKSKFVVAGGTIFNALYDMPASSDYYAPQMRSDIDIFFMSYGASEKERTNALRELLKSLDAFETKSIIAFYSNTINIMSKDYQDIQIVLRDVYSIEELLILFDLDCCRFAYDGEKVYTTREGIRSLVTCTNIVPRRHRYNQMYYRRAIKYGQRADITTIFHTLHPLDHLHGDIFYQDDYVENEQEYSKQNYPLVDDEDVDNDELQFWGTLYSGNAYDEDSEFYTSLNRLAYKDFAKIYKIGIDKWKGPDIAEYEGVASNETFISHMRDIDMNIAKKFTELFSMNASKLFTENYRDAHLMQKYCIVKCYLCNQYRQLFSEKSCKNAEEGLCSVCATRNEEKSAVFRDLDGHIAIVTGARIKIGYEVALKLLRANCRVIATTRFPADAWRKFQEEEDYCDWADKLEDIYPLDLRDGNAVNQFCAHIKEKYPRISILINNAAQTVRRPIEFYQDQIEQETKAIEEASEQPDMQLRKSSLDYTLSYLQVPAIGDKESNEEHFPKGQVDKFGVQVDNRTKHTWNTKVTQVSDIELLEVQAINNIAPTMIVSKLFDVMRVEKGVKPERSYVINVTSHEGMFETTGKTDYHVHTNQSKAALNMLTRSSATQFAKKGIIMNSVDTGWVSSGLPTFREPPLSAEDGAARILYPIFADETNYGHLFKNYEIVPW
jgi:NAD(P)-dependent dehydrogenase (short-subunit alcohol dehydrogenase family)